MHAYNIKLDDERCSIGLDKDGQLYLVGWSQEEVEEEETLESLGMLDETSGCYRVFRLLEDKPVEALLLSIHKYGSQPLFDLSLLLTPDLDLHKGIVLRMAVKFGSVEMIYALLEAGANPRIANDSPFKGAAQSGRIGVMEILRQEGADINAGQGFALRYAAMNNQVEMVDYLLAHGAEAHFRNYEAVNVAKRRKYGGVLKVFAEYGYTPLEFCH